MCIGTESTPKNSSAPSIAAASSRRLRQPDNTHTCTPSGIFRRPKMLCTISCSAASGEAVKTTFLPLSSKSWSSAAFLPSSQHLKNQRAPGCASTYGSPFQPCALSFSNTLSRLAGAISIRTLAGYSSGSTSGGNTFRLLSTIWCEVSSSSFRKSWQCRQRKLSRLQQAMPAL